MPTVAMTAPMLRVAHNTIGQVVEETKADPCNVQEARGQNKPCAVADGVGCGREFLAVRVTVKYREHCDNDRGSPYRCSQR